MKFSQKFFTYHGCGLCYVDGTNLIQSKSRSCFFPTHEPFWKDPRDNSNCKINKKSIEKENFCNKKLL